MAFSTPDVPFTRPDDKPIAPSLHVRALRAVLFWTVGLLGLLALLPLWLGDAMAWLARCFHRVRYPATLPNQEQASIVVLNYDGRHLLQECLPSVLAAVRHDGRNHEVIVVDNGSRDDSLEFLREHFPEVRIVSLDRNYHFAHGNNFGVSSARNDVVILLNNDMFVDRGFLRPLLDGFTDERVFAVASQIFFQDRERRREETGKTGGEWKRGTLELFHGEVTAGDLQRKTVPVLWAGGGSCAVDKHKFQALGGFDRLYYPFYLEDTDLSWEAWRRGWTVWLAPASVVIHKHRGTSAAKHSREFVQNTIRRNQILFVWKNVEKISWLFFHAWGLPGRLHDAIREGRFKFEMRAFFRALRKYPEAWSKRFRSRRAAGWSAQEVLDRTSYVRRWVGTHSIDFSQGGFEEQLGEGWFPVEANPDNVYRWTGRECSVLLYPRGEEEFLQLRGAIPGIELSRRPEVGVEIFQDGALIYSQWYDRPQSLFLKVRVILVAFQPHRFTVRLSSTFCPIEIGASSDIRKLGMTISELSLG
ncbi:MAG: glycosyltransferase family 2 protein [Acidobacteria bacterium]|nr:glycosyltransferase family 2 protein [Acidobacteriota bacterium]MCI0627761.1 glycosyltransferase family 2 protein [Acidobacteriota bacterium]MCI0723539.1 glycosyltransferase family 2 protein [Acidobacteriota bacterium]